MKCLLEETTTFMKEADWKDTALLKGSVFALGLAVGLSLTPHHKKTAALVSASVGIAAAVPLLYKFGKQIKR